MSTRFTDRFGREFNCVVTVAEAEQLKKELQIDLGEISDGKLFDRLSTDWGAMVSVCWIVCQESIAAIPGLIPEDFGKGFNGDVLGAAFDAFWEAVADFFPPRRRAALREMIAKYKQVEIETAKQAVERGAKIDLQKIVDQALTSFDSATNAAESQA